MNRSRRNLQSKQPRAKSNPSQHTSKRQGSQTLSAVGHRTYATRSVPVHATTSSFTRQIRHSSPPSHSHRPSSAVSSRRSLPVASLQHTELPSGFSCSSGMVPFRTRAHMTTKIPSEAPQTPVAPPHLDPSPKQSSAPPIMEVSPPKKGLLAALGLDSAERITLQAEDHATFNRWRIVPAAVLTHLSLGSIFAWSIFNQPLMHIDGIFEPVVSDWSLSQIMPVFSTTMASFGLSSMTLGRLGFNEKYGPKVTGLVGGSLFAGAFALSSLATATHSLPLLYAGYGLLGGLAVGAAYVGPIASLMKWFPDKKGLASAMAVMGFGAGGIFAAQFIERFLNKFRELPQYAGKLSDLKTKIIDGKMYATIDGIDREIIMASRTALNKLGKAGELLQEGAYFAGTGDVGISKTFLALGCMYTMAIVLSSFAFKLPNARYDPTLPGNVKPLESTAPVSSTVVPDNTATVKTQTAPAPLKPKFDYTAEKGDISPGIAIKTRQFWLLWMGMLCNSAAAYAVIGVGKTMMLDIYSNPYPMIVTSAFAATFVSMISAFNLSGRLFWGGTSDKIGRKRTFDLLWGLGVPFYLGIPLASHLLADGGSSMLPLALFYGSVCLAIANFGGSAAISPAYLSDLFGSKYAAANAGQLLSYLMVSGYLGPMTCAALRDMSIKQSIEKLSLLIDESTFINAFGHSKDRLNELIANKVVTIPKMMELCPPGTQDPTPFLYDTTFMTLAALQFVALLCNRSITKVDGKFFQQSAQIETPNAKTTIDIEVVEEPTKPAKTIQDMMIKDSIVDIKGVELDFDGIKKDMNKLQDRAKLDLSQVQKAGQATIAVQ